MKLLRVFSVIILLLLTAICGIFAYFYLTTYEIKLDESKFYKSDKASLVLLDYNDKEMEIGAFGYAKISELDDCVGNAFIAVEDKRFMSHGGVDYLRMAKAALNNALALSFKEGASTITQQLIKNTHLSSSKTLRRKFAEIRLARELERRLSKEQILELYLNSIYFGENAYGIEAASRCYFGKAAAELNLSEAATLAAIVKAPTRYSPYKDYDKCLTRRNTVIKLMYEQKFIDEKTYFTCKENGIVLSPSTGEKYKSYQAEVMHELGEKLNLSPYDYGGYKVYTYFDETAQTILENNYFDDIKDYDSSQVILNNASYGVIAYHSTCGSSNRQIGSTIKPFLIYAAAVQEDIISPSTLLLDEKTDFDGYSPKNYNDKYYGNISARFALSHSLNVPSVKILTYLGYNKLDKYAKRLDIDITNSKHPSLALGRTECGMSLIELSGKYAMLAMGGKYKAPAFIRKIVDASERTVYERNDSASEVYDEKSVFLVNDMLKTTVKEGTAKKLSYVSNIELAAKTGTVGNEEGNTDAYCIAFDRDYTVGSWLGNADSSYMPQNITGGGYATILNRDVWEELYNASYHLTELPAYCDGISRVTISDEAIKRGEILLCGDNEIGKTEYFKVGKEPKKKSNSVNNSITAHIACNSGLISIRLCQTQYNAEVYKNNKLIGETTNGEFSDANVTINKEYEYYLLPYKTTDDGKREYFNMIVLPKIKVSPEDDWWEE